MVLYLPLSDLASKAFNFRLIFAFKNIYFKDLRYSMLATSVGGLDMLWLVSQNDTLNF